MTQLVEDRSLLNILLLKYRHTEKIPGYTSWDNMKARCSNSNHSRTTSYKERGITYCERWSFFANFILDMGLRPEGMSLERLDNNGNYCKENCKWATSKEQGRNMQKTFLIYCYGKSYNVKEVSELLKCSQNTVLRMIYRGEFAGAVTKGGIPYDAVI